MKYCVGSSKPRLEDDSIEVRMRLLFSSKIKNLKSKVTPINSIIEDKHLRLTISILP